VDLLGDLEHPSRRAEPGLQTAIDDDFARAGGRGRADVVDDLVHGAGEGNAVIAERPVGERHVPDHDQLHLAGVPTAGGGELTDLVPGAGRRLELAGPDNREPAVAVRGDPLHRPAAGGFSSDQDQDRRSGLGTDRGGFDDRARSPIVDRVRFPHRVEHGNKSRS